MIRAAQLAAGAVLAIAALAYAGVPMPRLIGIGCDAYPLGVALAAQEDEIRAPHGSTRACDTIAPLWR